MQAHTPQEAELHVLVDFMRIAPVKRSDEQTAPNDISNQRRNADNAKLAVVARGMSAAVVITDANFIVEWCNDATSTVTGYTIEDLHGKNLLHVCEAFALSPAVTNGLVATAPAGHRFAATAAARRKNGEVFYAAFEVLPYFDEDGEVVAFIGISRDVTTKVVAEDALRESEEHLRDAQRLAGIGSWRYFLDTGEIRWSEELFRAFGRPLAEGPPTFDEYLAYLSPEDRSIMVEAVRRAVDAGTHYEKTFVITHRDGTKVWMHGRGNVRRNATGRVVELYGTSQDVTARVVAEKARLDLQARLASAQRLESLGLLAGGVAHDFNNLLMGIMMDASLLEREMTPLFGVAEAVANIRHAATRMAELTNQLLAYAGRGRFVRERVDPNEIATSEVEAQQQNLPPEVMLELDIAREPATVEIDSSQLRQVLVSLLSNARDALEGHSGKITIRTRTEKTAPSPPVWILEVSDSGSGMTEEVQRRIFEPFFTTKKMGRGLGLSTVHGLVQRSRGSIHIRSAVGAGTTFVVQLPLVKDEPVVQDRTLATVESRPLRILVADDEAMVRRSLRRMLELNRINVVEVADGTAALEIMKQQDEPFDIALLDIVMPRMSGYEVVTEMRAQQLPTKIILMSGFDNMGEVEDGKSPGQDADAMLQKPFAWDELKRTIQKVLHQDNLPFAERR